MVRTVLQLSAEVPAEWQIWATYISVAIAAGSFIVALFSSRTARQSLKLSKEQERRRVARLDVSLVKAVSWCPVNSKQRWIGARVLAVNPTDRDGAIVQADLHVTYSTSDGANVVAKIPHDPMGTCFPKGIEEFDLPISLPANGAVDGWLVFGLSHALLEGVTVERYEAVVRDSRGPLESVHPWVLEEIEDCEASKEAEGAESEDQGQENDISN
ncbi:hypothetical protein [Haloechinothrix halophila]|uniref:hypothetical protein n=1 Tax=Haloechinothrix halophila TaxID=1069073 RepID=UPI0012F89232|nr:hypothetical protein [Haloechinothrix halophila]